MVPHERVKQQLKAIGADFQFFGRAENRELPKVLFDDEHIQHAVYGKYSGGFATLFATNQRVLLIDKKPLYLTLEDVRYDMISDMMFNNRLLSTSLMLGTVHKSITFIAYNQHRLRDLTTYVQKRVMDFRQQQTGMQAPQPANGLFNTYVPGITDEEPQVQYQPPAMSPYKNPVVIRKRASKFFF